MIVLVLILYDPFKGNCCRALAWQNTILVVTRSSCFFVSSLRPSYVLSTSRTAVAGDVGPVPGGSLSIQVLWGCWSTTFNSPERCRSFKYEYDRLYRFTFRVRFKIWDNIRFLAYEIWICWSPKASIFRQLCILREFVLRHFVWSQNYFSLRIKQHARISLFVEKRSLLYYREWYKVN